MTLDTYNPTGFSKYGSQITTKQSFKVTATTGISATVRARLDSPVRGGGVAGIFFYAVNPHNEIDTELLTNDVIRATPLARSNVYANEPLGAGHPDSAVIPNGGKLTQFHTYTMTAFSDRVLWHIDGHLVRTETATVPIGPMKFYLNFWAPGKEWALAYNSKLRSVSSPGKNTRLTYDVDSVVIKSVKSPTAAVKVTGASVTSAAP